MNMVDQPLVQTFYMYWRLVKAKALTAFSVDGDGQMISVISITQLFFLYYDL